MDYDSKKQKVKVSRRRPSNLYPLGELSEANCFRTIFNIPSALPREIKNRYKTNPEYRAKQDAYSMTHIDCKCGRRYMRSNSTQHKNSITHRMVLAAIESMKNQSAAEPTLVPEQVPIANIKVA